MKITSNAPANFFIGETLIKGGTHEYPKVDINNPKTAYVLGIMRDEKIINFDGKIELGKDPLPVDGKRAEKMEKAQKGKLEARAERRKKAAEKAAKKKKK